MNAGPVDWDAKTYEKVSDPQFNWGIEVLERLELEGGETVIDAGIGSGRVAEKLLERLPDGLLVGIDASAEMIDVAGERFERDESVTLIVSDLLEMTPELLEGSGAPATADVLFSTATFHWVPDHDALFSAIHSVLQPGGRLVAQCGGEGNVAKHAEAIVTVASRPEFASHFEGMSIMWNFAPPDETEERLRRAGFSDVRCWLQDKPVQPDDPRAFTSTVTMGPHLSRLPDELRDRFVDSVLEIENDPLVLNYVRLNIEATA